MRFYAEYIKGNSNSRYLITLGYMLDSGLNYPRAVDHVEPYIPFSERQDKDAT